MPKPRITLIANLKAGSLAPGLLDDVKASLSDAGINYDLIQVQHLNQKTQQDFAPVIVAVGGDGTVNLAAQLAVKYQAKLGVIPSGTFNHFAKDVGIPIEPDQAIKRLMKGRIKQIDIASVNDQIIINNSVIGFYPKAVEVKNNLRHIVGRAMATAASTIYALRRFKTYYLKVEADDETINVNSRLLVVANNRYDFSQFGLAARKNLESGWLYAYYVNSPSIAQLARLGLKLLSGRIKQSELETIRTRKLKIIYRKPKLRVAIDGEVVHLTTPLNYEIHPKALSVII